MKSVVAVLLIFLVFATFSNAVEVKSKSIQDTCAHVSKNTDSNCNTCGVSVGESKSALYTNTMQLLGISIIILLLSYYLYSLKKKKIYFIGAASLIALLSIITFHPKFRSDELSSLNKKSMVSDSAVDVFTSPLDEFQQVTDSNASVNSQSIESADEFSAATDEFTSSTDEFSSSTDEFISADANSEFAQNNENGSTSNANENVSEQQKGFTILSLSPSDSRLLIENLVLFLLIVLIGIFIKNCHFQNFKGLFLVSTLIYFGFFKGGCPCMIMSFQKLILFFIGIKIDWVGLVWFLMLLPATYFFGKIWCGWLCHLGALQEFLFAPSQMKLLKSVRSQLIIRRVRIAILIILLFQLIITKTNIFVHYDPFKVAFNLFSSNTLGYVLLVLMVVSSVLIYRPFCRIVCPVGLILGWVSLLPKAKTIKKTIDCIDCVSCSKSCDQRAIIFSHNKSYLSVQDCIMCGNCLSTCKKKSLILKK